MTWQLHYTLTFWLHDTGWLTVLLGLALLFAGLVSVRLGFGNPPPALPTIVPLAALCQRWARPSPKVVHIAELVHLWRAEPGEGLGSLSQPRARAFARQLGEWAFFRKFPLQQAVCTRIVQLLDREGLCPSVVDTRGDVESAWDATTYRILAKTTLLDHSLIMLINSPLGSTLFNILRQFDMAFSDFTGRLCERIRFRYYPPREIEEYLQEIGLPDSEDHDKERQV